MGNKKIIRVEKILISTEDSIKKISSPIFTEKNSYLYANDFQMVNFHQT